MATILSTKFIRHTLKVPVFGQINPVCFLRAWVYDFLGDIALRRRSRLHTRTFLCPVFFVLGNPSG